MEGRPESKEFSDRLDGTFSLPSYCMQVVDTPHFQRLRNLSQLGVTRFVFHGAVHTRFEHSLGTALKAYKVSSHILKNQGGERGGLQMDRRDVKLVTLAGLCHDLGHGPLSHPFEHFLKQRGITDWQHEDMSGLILDHMLDTHLLSDDVISREEVRFIQDLVKGLPSEHAPGAHGAQPAALWRPNRRFLFDIVANKRNGVDVDKMDYLPRDALHCNVAISCDLQRLTRKKFVRVLDDELCYPWSEYDNVLELFHAREILHRKVYTNRKCKAVELMAVDALVAAEPLLRMAERVHTAADFLALDDGFLTMIEHYRAFHRGTLEDAEERALSAAQHIVGRLRRRELYQYGNQCTVPPELLRDGRWEGEGGMKRLFTPEHLCAHYPGGEVALRPEHILCDDNRIDWAAGGANPVDKVGFFDRRDGERTHIRRHQLVGIAPEYYQERVLRVFTREADPRYRRAISEALAEWSRVHFKGAVRLATPLRARPPADAAGGAAGAAGAAAGGLAPRQLGPVLAREAVVAGVQLDLRGGPPAGGGGAAAVVGNGPEAEAGGEGGAGGGASTLGKRRQRTSG